MQASVLVVDDEKNIRSTLRMVLEGADMEVIEAEAAEEALERIFSGGVDIVILDVRLPGMSGLEALQRIRQRDDTSRLPVIMVSGHATLQEAVQAVQQGATDFFEKPLDRDRVLVSVRNAVRTWQLQREVDRLRADVEQRYEMIGESQAMKQLFSHLEKVAPTPGRVLITGESGTGKELVARAIHRLSPRQDGPFIKVNCAAIPSELIESELFGYERGAFTGAQNRKKGMFELSSGGTLFLDEIGDMSLDAQAKVLRALQSGEITRVGSEKPLSVDVRVIVASNKDLETEVAEGRFREDLYYRLAVVPLRCPPLRERREDIPRLAEAFLREFCRSNGLKEKEIEPEVLDALSKRPWAGNVRELKNVVERMVILGGDPITVDDLPEETRLSSSELPPPPDDEPSSAEAVSGSEPGERMTLRAYREQAEREYILRTLNECAWNISRAAEQLGVERTNLHKKMRAYGIRRDESES